MLYHDVKHWDECQIQEGRGDHAADHRGADRMPRLLAGAGRKHQRQHAEDEGERGHQNRPQADARGFDRRVRRSSCRAARSCSANSTIEDAVLRREADQHHQPDLAVDVVDQPAAPLRQQRAENRERHRQQDDERQRHALVLRRQRQVDQQQAEPEDDDRLAAGLEFLERDAGPGELMPCGSDRFGASPSPAAPGPN